MGRNSSSVLLNICIFDCNTTLSASIYALLEHDEYCVFKDFFLLQLLTEELVTSPTLPLLTLLGLWTYVFKAAPFIFSPVGMMLLWPEQPVMWCLSAARSVLLNFKKITSCYWNITKSVPMWTSFNGHWKRISFSFNKNVLFCLSTAAALHELPTYPRRQCVTLNPAFSSLQLLSARLSVVAVIWLLGLCNVISPGHTSPCDTTDCPLHLRPPQKAFNTTAWCQRRSPGLECGRCPLASPGQSRRRRIFSHGAWSGEVNFFFLPVVIYNQRTTSRPTGVASLCGAGTVAVSREKGDACRARPRRGRM